MAITRKDGSIEIKDIVAIIRRRKWLIIIPTIIITAITFAGSFILPERFESSTMVVIDENMQLSRALQEYVPGQNQGGFVAMQERENRLISIRNEIISTQYLSRLIDELNLNQSQSVTLRAQKMHNERPDVEVDELIYRILVEDLRNNISVAFNGQNIVQITAESGNPKEAMDIATKLAEIFKDEQLKRDLSGVRGALDFSDEQLAIYRKNLEEAEDRYSNFRTRFLQNQLDESVSADTNIRAIMADIDNISLRIEKNINDQTRVRTSLSNYKKSELNLETGNEYTDILSDIYAETKRLADFMSRYTWSDPKVINANLSVNNKTTQLEGIIDKKVPEQFPDAPREERRLLSQFFALKLEEDINRQKKKDFEVSLSMLRDRIAKQPEYEIQLENYENEVASARQIYETFRNQLTGSEISQSLMRGGAESKYRVMEPAAIPLAPVKPDRIRLSLMGFVLGIVLGGVAVLLAEIFDNSFKKVEDVEEILSAPVLATIPSIQSIKGKIKV
ncbi:MAG: Wzz/FepE/Etk N-terminal domain-containing protein [Candidatus Zixiibacteriota bacterium]